MSYVVCIKRLYSFIQVNVLLWMWFCPYWLEFEYT